MAHLVEPEQLRRQDVAENQREVKGSIGTVKTLLDKKNVKLVATVRRHEEFKKISIRNDQAGGQHDLGHVVQVAHGDEVFEAICLAERNRDGQDHGEARINGASHEIRRKDRGVPAGNDGDGKIEADHRMYAE